MSTNGQLVFTDVDKITFKGVGNTSNAVVDTVTGKIGVGIDNPDANLHVLGNSYVSTNLELGGTLIMGTVNVEAYHSLEAVTATGNTTPLTVEFSNATTGLVTTGNVQVGKELTVTGNATISSNLTVSGNVEVGESPKQYQKLTANDGATGDYFGYSVSIDGDTMVIGAYGDDDNGSISGSAYVFTRTNGVWTQVAKLTADDGAADDYFGYSVAISGDTVVIGAYRDDDNGIDSGSAYVFTRNTAGDLTSGWTQRAKLTADDGAANDYFGWSVSIDGDTVVIGAYRDDSYEGSAYVFTHTNGVWTQRAKLTASDGVIGIRFGYTVSIDGDTVVIGAERGLPDPEAAPTGSAYVFTRDTAGDLTSSWTQVAKLLASDGAEDDWFASSVSIDGDTVVISASGGDDDGSNSGSAYVFMRDTAGDLTSGWTQLTKLTANDAAANDWFGWSVSIDGDTVVIGASDGPSGWSGSAYVFMRNTSGWTQVAKLTANDGAANDYFGESVSIDGNTILIGAYGDGSTSGSVYTFSTPVIKDITVTGNATVAKELTVTGSATISSNLTVSGNAMVSSNLTVSGFVGTSETGALTVPYGTTAQQPTGVTGMIRFNTTRNKLEYHDGTVWVGIGEFSAIGGDHINEVGVYKIHIFENSGTFQTYSNGNVDILIVGGGGAGGGGRHAGGGGAGAVIHATNVFLNPGEYIITIGGGGGGRAGNVVPTAGSSTTIVKSGTTLYTAIAGGYGGIHPSTAVGTQHEYGQNGGCGGGAGHSTTQTATGFQRSGLGLSTTPAFGGNGGAGLNRAATGGGGGAGANGATGTGGETAQSGTGGSGGTGYQTDITGTSLYWAGGGGGSASPDTYRNSTAAAWIGGDGGNGGGGGGATGVRSDASGSRAGNGGTGYNSGTAGAFTIVANACHGGNGGVNTGGGGGGAGGWSNDGNGNGGNGGKGIVVIRYLK